MTKMTRSGLVYSVMNANADKPMHEVLQLIVDADAASGIPGKVCDLKRAKAYYTDAVKKGLAGGVGPGPKSSTRAPRAAKAEKPAKTPKIQKVPAPRIAGEKEKPLVTDKTVEEINDIKAKNLARLREVGRKHYANQANGKSGGFTKKQAKEAVDYVNAVTNDLDSFKVPTFLTKDELSALI